VITLKKESGPADLAGVTKLGIGVSWDPTSGASGGALGWAKRKKGVDLDLIAIIMVGNDPVRLAGLDSLDPLQNGAITHSGDNQTGHGAGDDETVEVDFAKVSGTPATSVVFLAAAFKKGTDFTKARNVSFKVYDSTGGSTDQVADIWPSLLGGHNVNAVAKATLVGEVWQLQVLNEPGKIKQGDESSLLRFAIGK
jgi:tellurium resistance protein TerZ